MTERAPGASGRPPSEVMDVVRDTAGDLSAVLPRFHQAYYDQLVLLVPALLQTTPDHGRAVAAVLSRQILWAATCTDPPDVVIAELSRSGAELRRAGFPAEGSLGASHAALRAVRHTYPLDWDGRSSSCWVAYLSWFVERLDAGPAGVAPPAAVPPAALPPAALPPAAGAPAAGVPRLPVREWRWHRPADDAAAGAAGAAQSGHRLG